MKERARQRELREGAEQAKAPAEGAARLRDAVLELQRTAGNGAVEGLIGARPLDPSLRGALERRFGADLSHVRLHADAEAGRRALEERAAAVTTGADVHFAPGRYQPGTEAGQTLIAHEIAHVVQLTRNARGRPLGTAELEAEASGGGAVAGRAAGGVALHADDQLLEDQKRGELKRLLTAHKDSWMDYLDHPVYSQILHDDLEIGRSLVGDPRFRRWLDEPTYRPKQIAKVTPATKPIEAKPKAEEAPLSPAYQQRDWAKEFAGASGEQRAASMHEELTYKSRPAPLPGVPVYYTQEMAELDAPPGVFKHVPGANIGWSSAELAWGKTAGSGLEVDREEKAKELAVMVGKEAVQSWAVGRVFKGVEVLDEARSLALAADEAAKAALRPTTALIPGRTPVRGPSLVKPPAPKGAGATALESVKPPPWKPPARPGQFFGPSGGGQGGMRLELAPVPRPGGEAGFGVRPAPVFNPEPAPTEGMIPKPPPGKDVPGRFQFPVPPVKATPPLPEAAPRAVSPQGEQVPKIWLPGLGQERGERTDVEAPPAERREPITEKETPPPMPLDPKPEHQIGKIDPTREGEDETMQVAGKQKAKAAKPKKSNQPDLSGVPSDPTPVMSPGEELRHTQYSPEANREARFRRQWMIEPEANSTATWGNESVSWDENKNPIEVTTTVLEPGVRDQQALHGLPGAKAGDEAGHMLGVAFGHVDAIWGKGAVVPQSRKVNTGGGKWWLAERAARAAALARQQAGQKFKLRSEAKGFKNGRPSHTRISVDDENAVPVYDSGWIKNP